MADSNQFTIVISAIDRATATFRAIKHEMAQSLADAPAVQLARSVGALGQSLAGLAAETGLSRLAEHASHATVSIVKLGGHIVRDLIKPLELVGGLSSGLGLLIGAGSVAGLFEVARGAAETGAALLEQSEKTGVAVGALAQLHYVAKQTGTETNVLDKGLEHLNKSIGDSLTGRAKAAAATFQRLHINLHAGHHQIRTAADIWDQLSEAVRTHTNAVDRENIVSTLFGSKMGADLIPMLVLGSKATGRLRQEFDELHGPFTLATGIAAKEAIESWRRLDEATQGLKDSIGYALAPAITSVITPLTKWIAANRAIIASDIGRWASDAAKWLKNINWAKAEEDAIKFANTVEKAFGDLYKVLQGVVWLFDHLTLQSAGQQARLHQWAARDGWRVDGKGNVLAAPPGYSKDKSGEWQESWGSRLAGPLGVTLLDPLFRSTSPPPISNAGMVDRFEHVNMAQPLAAQRGDGLGTLKVQLNFSNPPPGLRVGTVDKPKNVDTEFNLGGLWDHP